jgi:FAD/FMN-containing dehydrogenase
MITATASIADLAALQDDFTGTVVTPADAAWDDARRAWHLMADQHPVAVAIPDSVEDVQHVVRFAAEAGLRVAPQAEGHNAGAFRSLEDTILVRMTGLTGVEIDAERRVARVAAGAKWRDVTGPASELGLAALHGSSPEVGVVGYSLGGGIGWYARKHGMQANSITAVELVTAEGELVRATTEEHADLFWAVRGGGGNFGIVVALEFRLYDIPVAYAGMLAYPWERASEVLHAWLDWTRTAPEEVTTSARILRVPPLEELPEIVRGRDFVVIDGAVLGDDAEAQALLAPLRELDVEIDTFAMVPAAVVPYIHMDPEDPIPALATHQMLDDLTHQAIDALLDAAGPASGTSLLMTELRHLGGALGRVPEGAGALGKLGGGYLVFAAGMVMEPEVIPALQADLARVDAALAPYDNGLVYANFSERPTDASEIYAADALERLEDVKAQYDPENVLRANHEIAPEA